MKRFVQARVNGGSNYDSLAGHCVDLQNSGRIQEADSCESEVCVGLGRSRGGGLEERNGNGDGERSCGVSGL